MFTRHLAACAALSLMTAAAGAAEPATTRLPDVRLQSVRTDVATVCPSVHSQLPERLASAFNKMSRPGVVKVEFQLDGRQLADIQASGGPREYRRHVRTAVSELECVADAPTPQRFAFAVEFIDIDARPATRVAILEAR